MPDPRFFLTGAPLTVAECLVIAGEAAGAAPGRVARAAALDDDDLEAALVFAEKDAARVRLAGRRVGLALVTKGGGDGLAVDGAVAECRAPRLAFARIAARLHRVRPAPSRAGADPAAKIAAGAEIHPTAIIGPDAEIGAGAAIHPYAVIGPGVAIGEGTRVGAHASVFCALVGRDVEILPGARIGEAGFGFVDGPDGPERMPQLGRVLIGDGAEIGAGTAIDRGALGDTVIGDRVKIDNLVQIGHNVRIGRGSVIAAHTGISGSVTIGERVLMGGKVGVSDHVVIGDGAQIAAAAGVMRDIGAGERWGGSPARPIKTWFRETAALARLAEGKKKSDAD